MEKFASTPPADLAAGVAVRDADPTRSLAPAPAWPALTHGVPVRDRDTTANRQLDERLYYLNDANMHVTARVDTNGSVVERPPTQDAYHPVASVSTSDVNGRWS